MYQLVNLAQKFSLFSEQWQPKVVAEMNDYQFKIVRIAGDFIWHSHPETDETLMVVEGVLRVDFRDGHVLVKAGEMIVVPRGVEHKTSAETEATRTATRTSSTCRWATPTARRRSTSSTS